MKYIEEIIDAHAELKLEKSDDLIATNRYNHSIFFFGGVFGNRVRIAVDRLPSTGSMGIAFLGILVVGLLSIVLFDQELSLEFAGNRRLILVLIRLANPMIHLPELSPLIIFSLLFITALGS